MKKGISVVLAFVCCLLLILPTAAYAVDAEEPITFMLEENVDTTEDGISIGTFVTNEYDMYLEMQNTPTALLLENGYEPEEITELKSTSVEEILYERGQMSEKALIGMGYSQETIKLLKEYDGSPIEDNPQLYALFADLTGTLNAVRYGTNKMAVQFDWEWSRSPMLAGTLITDIVSCGFAATNEDGVFCSVTYDRDTSKCRVYYYVGDGDSASLVNSKTIDISAKNIHQNVEAKIPMSQTFSDSAMGWAKSGYLTVGIKEEKTLNRLYSGTFAFGYGHKTGTATPSISVSVGSGGISGGVGLSFGTGTANMFYKTMNLRATGRVDIFDGE